MAWDLETAKAYLGITDPQYDAVVQQAMDTVVHSLASVLGRVVIRGTFTEEFHNPGSLIHLKNFPVESIEDLIAPSTIVNYTLRHDSGLLSAVEMAGMDKVTVEYIGAYGALNQAYPLPLDLERAMYEILIDLWDRTDPETGGPSQIVVASTGQPQKITVFDGFAIDYGSGAAVADESSAALVAAWGWLAPWASTLQMYQAGVHSGAGGMGIA